MERTISGEIKSLGKNLYNTVNDSDESRPEYYIYPEVHHHYLPILPAVVFNSIEERFPQLEEAIERLKKLKTNLIGKIIEKYGITRVFLEGIESSYTTTDDYKDLINVLKKYNVEISYLDDIGYWSLDNEEREKRWIKKLSEVKHEKVLIICGAAHTFSLLSKLKNAYDLPSLDTIYYFLLINPIYEKLGEYNKKVIELAELTLKGVYNEEEFGRKLSQYIREIKNWFRNFLEARIPEIREKEIKLFEKYGIRID